MKESGKLKKKIEVAKESQKMKHQRGEVIALPTFPPVLISDYKKIKSKTTVKDHLLHLGPFKSDGFVLSCLL